MRLDGKKFKVQGFTDIGEGDEEALTQAISLQCVSVGLDASLPSFQFYSCNLYFSYLFFFKMFVWYNYFVNFLTAGVYSDSDCSSVNLNHGVLAVGYGTDSVSGLDYYLIKNSWGKTKIAILKCYS